MKSSLKCRTDDLTTHSLSGLSNIYYSTRRFQVKHQSFHRLSEAKLQFDCSSCSAGRFLMKSTVVMSILSFHSRAGHA